VAFTKEQAKLAIKMIKADPEIGRRKLSAALGCPSHIVEKFLVRWKAGTKDTPDELVAMFATRAYRSTRSMAVTPPGTNDPSQVAGVSVREFVGRFDYAGKLRKLLKETCSNAFVPDSEIRALSGISIPSFKLAASLPEFKACQIKEGGTLYWSTKNNVDQVRAQANKWGVQR
jgi:hypothetical protein